MIGCIDPKDFNFEINQFSPVFGDIEIRNHHDDGGNEVQIAEHVDYKKLSASLGTVRDYDLASLIDAGLDPSRFAVHTGNNARIESVNVLQSIEQNVNEIFKD